MRLLRCAAAHEFLEATNRREVAINSACLQETRTRFDRSTDSSTISSAGNNGEGTMNKKFFIAWLVDFHRLDGRRFSGPRGIAA